MDVADGTMITWSRKQGHWFATSIKGPLRDMLIDARTGFFCAEPSVKRLLEKRAIRFSWRSKPHDTSLRLPLSEPFPYPNPDNIITPQERNRMFPPKERSSV